MKSAPVPRWAISFADLGLLLLGCFVLLHSLSAQKAREAAAAAAAAPDAPHARATDGYAATALFEAGEARLTPAARARLQAEGRAAGTRAVQIVSRGMAEGTNRLDRFELTAARAASVGRALQEGGVLEQNIAVRLERVGGDGGGQQIAVVPR